MYKRKYVLYIYICVQTYLLHNLVFYKYISTCCLSVQYLTLFFSFNLMYCIDLDILLKLRLSYYLREIQITTMKTAFKSVQYFSRFAQSADTGRGLPFITRMALGCLPHCKYNLIIVRYTPTSFTLCS